MSYEIHHGVVDNDTKGETGVGTIYWCEVRKKNTVIVRFEYGMMNQLNNTFILDYHLQPYRDAIARDKKAEADKLAAEKKQELKERTDSITEDPEVVDIIKGVIASDTKSVEQYKAGKEKALNALVGKVIGQIKQNNLSYEAGAFGINKLLVKYIG